MELVMDKVSLSYSLGIKALQEIDLEIKPGVFGLLEPNGAGKSTLLKIFATTLNPTAGAVRVGPYELPREQQQVREHLGYLPQAYGLFDNLTAEECMHYFALMKGMEERKKRRDEVDRLLQLVRLQDDCRHRRIKTFSGGMKQRLALAQALIGSPPLLILDEPTAGLDPEERLRMRNMLSSLGRERTVILSTHIVPDITAVCSQVGVLHKGRLLFTGEIEELAARARGLVWELALYAPDYEPRPGEILVASRREGGALRLRLLCAGPPASGAVSVEPGAEDGYMALVSALIGQGGGGAA